MHIESYSINNQTYIRLAESVVVARGDGKTAIKKKIILSLGNIKKYDDGKPDYLKRLRESFSIGTPIIPELQPYIKGDKKNAPSTEADYLEPKNLGFLLLEALFDGLEGNSVLTRHKSRNRISYDLLGLSKLMIHGRILDPQSRYQTFKRRDAYTFPITAEENHHHIYYTLTELASAKSALLQRYNTVLSRSGRRTDLTYYDVTNYYFEIDENDPDELDANGNVIKKGFRKKGVSKENRKQPLVQMGLLIDREGLPITYDLYPGNTLDHSTFQPSMSRLETELALDRVIVVADRGMINYKNILSLKDNGYVMSKSIKKSNKEEKEWTTNPEGFSGVPGDDFRVKSRIVTKKIKNDDGQHVTLNQKQVVYWSRRFYNREMKENESFLKMLEEFVEAPERFPVSRFKGLSKFVETCHVDKETGEILDTKALQFVKEEKVKEYSRYFGYYMIVTSEIDKSDDEIIDIYRGLTRIENCFRTVKSDFKGRPIHVQKEEHIEAHFLVCFTALLMMRIIQRQILRYQGLETTHTFDWEEGLSASRVQEALKTFQSAVDKDGSYRLTRPTADLELILKAFGLGHPGAQCTRSDLVQFKNKLKKQINSIFSTKNAVN